MAFSSLSIGTSALITARYGLDVTGQNLGNIDTPGYTRQVIRTSASKGYSSTLGTGIIGNGVWVDSVKRVSDEYIEKQLRQAVSQDEYYGNLQNCYSKVQVFFNELSVNDTGLSDSIGMFWDAMSDFANKVENVALRSTAVKQAEAMTDHFNRIGNQLEQYRRDINDEVAGSISQINRIINEIAYLNENIVSVEKGGLSNVVANDLRDQRGELVKELYEYMDVDVVEEDNGAYIVSIHGRNLVYYNQAKEIRNEQVMDKDGVLVNNPVFASDGYPLSPKDGQLAAQIEMRDEIINGYLQDLNTLSANFIWEVNRAYSQTRGLESFDSLTALNGPTNPAATLDQLTYNDEMVPGTFQIVNGNLQIIVHNRNTNEGTIVPIEIDLDGRPGPNGEPDMILYDPANPNASNSLVNRMQQALDDAAPGIFEVSIDSQNRLSITSKSEDFGFSFGKDTSGVLAALGMNVLFSGHNASSMGVNKVVKDNPLLLGGAYSFTKGDADGAQDILAVREKTLGNLNSMTLEGYYQSVIGRLGSEASSNNKMKYLAEDVLSRMTVQRESLSGVSEDEEVTKLITYQRAFQSAAKFISTVDQLYETLMNM